MFGYSNLRDALHLEARPICYWNRKMWLDKKLKSSLVIGQKVEIVQSASRCKASLSFEDINQKTMQSSFHKKNI